MSEPATQIGFSMIRPIAMSILSVISKRLLKRYFPINENRLNVQFSISPRLYLSDAGCPLDFSFKLDNFTLYDLTVRGYEVEFQFENYNFAPVNTVAFILSRIDASVILPVKRPLVPYEVAMIKKVGARRGTLNSTWILRLFVRSKLGEQTVEKKLYGVAVPCLMGS